MPRLELIAAALVKLGETVLAEKVRTRCAAPMPSPLASSTVRVVLDKSLVVRLSTLEREFAFLAYKPQDVPKENKSLGEGTGEFSGHSS